MLLRPAQAREARAALSALSRAFLAFRPRSPVDPSLADGQAGLALVHAALDHHAPRAGHAAAAQSALARASRALARRPLSPWLDGGFTGVAWVAEVLGGEGGADDTDGNMAVDEALEGFLGTSAWSEPYDLLGGLTGLGVYAVARAGRPSGKRLVAQVVGHLASTAWGGDRGVTWRSRPEWVASRWRQVPFPTFNLGVAHGVPGVIALLGRVVALEVDPATKRTARELLEGAVAWLEGQELGSEELGAFPAGVGDGVPRTLARMAWCYGDLGIAAAMLVAARGAKERAWERAAIRIALRAAKRPPDSCGVIDAGLCHGAAGAGHIFHRLFRATGREELADAARLWFARTLSMREGSRGLAGFRAWRPDRRGELAWCSDAGLLTGAGGVALALQAALGGEQPAWGGALLLP
jgi:lantibiotic modifying enzyme